MKSKFLKFLLIPLLIIGLYYIFFTTTEKDFDGNVYLKCTYNIFTQTRKCKVFDEKGQLEEIYSTRKDYKHGINTVYHRKSTIIFESVEYKNGKIWNVLEYNDPNGNPLDYGELKNGNGYVCTYHENGKKRCCGSINNGYKNGFWDYYDKNLNFVFKSEFENGYDKRTNSFRNFF